MQSVNQGRGGCALNISLSNYLAADIIRAQLLQLLALPEGKLTSQSLVKTLNKAPLKGSSNFEYDHFKIEYLDVFLSNKQKSQGVDFQVLANRPPYFPNPRIIPLHRCIQNVDLLIHDIERIGWTPLEQNIAVRQRRLQASAEKSRMDIERDLERAIKGAVDKAVSDVYRFDRAINETLDVVVNNKLGCVQRVVRTKVPVQ